MRRGSRGASLLELVVASGLMSVLFGLLFVVFRMGARAWLTNDTKAELLGRIQSLSARIGRQAENSIPSSLSVADSDLDPNIHGCSFLTASDDEGRLQYDPFLTQPIWTDTRVFYFDSAKQEVFAVTYPLAGSSRRERLLDYAARFTEPPKDNSLNPTPRNALIDMLVSGQPIAHDIKQLRFEKVERDILLSNGDTKSRYYEQLAISITVEKESYGVTKPIELSSRSVYLLRN